MAANPQFLPERETCDRKACPRYGLNLWRSSIREWDIKGSGGNRKTTIVTYSCRPPRPHLWHYEDHGPHGEPVQYVDPDGKVVQDVENRRGKHLSIRYTDSVTGEIVETESSHARVMKTERVRKAISRGVKHFRQTNPEQAAEIDKALVDYVQSQDGRATISASMTKRAKDPAYIDQQRETTLGNWKNLQVARKRIRGTRKALAKPDVKERQVNGLKSAWARKKAKEAAEKAELEELRAGGTKKKAVGRPRSTTPTNKQKVFIAAAQRYDRMKANNPGTSWGMVGQKVLPEEYERDPDGVADRLRLGAKDVRAKFPQFFSVS